MSSNEKTAEPLAPRDGQSPAARRRRRRRAPRAGAETAVPDQNAAPATRQPAQNKAPAQKQSPHPPRQNGSGGQNSQPPRGKKPAAQPAPQPPRRGAQPAPPPEAPAQNRGRRSQPAPRGRGRAEREEDPGLELISRRPPKQKYANFEEYMAAHGGATAPIPGEDETPPEPPAVPEANS